MALTRPNLFKLLAVAATFFAALGAFALITRSGGGAARSGLAAADGDLPRPGASTDERIRGFQAAVRATPDDAALRAALAGAYLQKVRETGDPGFYARADAVLRRARALAPSDYRVLTASGTLALARHDFAGGLAHGLAARRANPASDAAYPVIVDGLVELGRYDQAGRELQRFVDAKPVLASYSRVSYFRELPGDLAGAAPARPACRCPSTWSRSARLRRPPAVAPRAAAISSSWARRSASCGPTESTPTWTWRCSRPTTAARHGRSRWRGARGPPHRACAR